MTRKTKLKLARELYRISLVAEQLASRVDPRSARERETDFDRLAALRAVRMYQGHWGHRLISARIRSSLSRSSSDRASHAS